MHQSMGLLTRSMFVSALVFMSLPVVACVDPEQDYNDYVSRTADAHAPPPMMVYESGVETGPLYAPDASFMSNKFFQICLSDSAAGDVTKANTFVASITYTPSPGGGGKITMSNQTLVIGATSLSDLTGMQYTATPNPATVNPDGTATLAFGVTQVPANSNPVTGMTLTFSQTTLGMHIESETQMCSSLLADVTAPTPAEIRGICIFRYVPNGSPLPSYQLSDFHCP
jgi:hypothetical protein